MSATTLVAILALIGYALYRQTRTTQLTGHGMYKLAAIYAIVGVAIGIQVDHTPAALALLAVGLLASVVIGSIRGRHVRIWQDADGRFFTRGTPLTIGLFLGLVAFKFALGTVAYFAHISYDASIGEVLLMVGLMLAMQAYIVARRAAKLGFIPEAASTVPQPAGALQH